MEHSINWLQRHPDRLLMPYFLRRSTQAKTADIIVDPDHNMSVGEAISSVDINEITGGPMWGGVISEIQERRPAKGTWERRPDFIKVKVQ